MTKLHNVFIISFNFLVFAHFIYACVTGDKQQATLSVCVMIYGKETVNAAWAKLHQKKET